MSLFFLCDSMLSFTIILQLSLVASDLRFGNKARPFVHHEIAKKMWKNTHQLRAAPCVTHSLGKSKKCLSFKSGYLPKQGNNTSSESSYQVWDLLQVSQLQRFCFKIITFRWAAIRVFSKMPSCSRSSRSKQQGNKITKCFHLKFKNKKIVILKIWSIGNRHVNLHVRRTHWALEVVWHMASARRDPPHNKTISQHHCDLITTESLFSNIPSTPTVRPPPKCLEARPG